LGDTGAADRVLSSPTTTHGKPTMADSENDRWKDFTTTMRFFGEMRFKQLTIFIAFLAIVGGSKRAAQSQDWTTRKQK